MNKLDIQDIHRYRRNKNIHFEGTEKKPRFFLLKHFSRKRRSTQSRVVITERIIEYPIVFQYLKQESKKVLDFGCVEDLLPIHLASIGYQVTGLDFRVYPFEHPNFSFIQADILKWEPPQEHFDAVISVSTIEHVGLSAYGDPECSEGDKIAVEKLWQSLRKGGDMIVTVPAGKPCTERGMRIYDEAGIRDIFPKVDILRFFCKPDRYAMWQEASSETISQLTYENYNALVPSQGVATVICRKR
jgi:2-polyprenyl-3-methyl-5-hydroxy-6-metoxy-1,4-benzoquinol methylase